MIKASVSERFWEKVDIRSDDECWNWKASIRSDGYGQLNRGKRGLGMESAHRVSWTIHFGDIPVGLHILHSCDNKLCVNPSHLFLGTNSDNVSDKVKKDRQMKGESVPTSKLNRKDIKEIRKLYVPWSRDYSIASLAKQFNVSYAAIYKVVSRETWIWVN